MGILLHLARQAKWSEGKRDPTDRAVSEKPLPRELTKPTQAPSVSFVSAPSRHIPEIVEGSNPAAEARQQRVLAMLAHNPTARYAVLTDTTADPEAVILALAVRGVGTCELRIPKAKYDPFLLLDLIEQHGGMVH